MKRILPGTTALLLLLSGCASGGLSSDPSAYGAASADIAVRSFLDATADEDYARMGRLFGTRDGPAERKWGITDVEQRMVVMAKFLSHSSYEVRRRDLPATGEHRARFVAHLEGTRKGSVSVPVVAVQAESGRWFVEQVEMESLTGRGAG